MISTPDMPLRSCETGVGYASPRPVAQAPTSTYLPRNASAGTSPRSTDRMLPSGPARCSSCCALSGWPPTVSMDSARWNRRSPANSVAGVASRTTPDGGGDRRRIRETVQHDGQDRMTVAPDAVRKDPVVVGVDGIAFREDQVQPDSARALQAVKQRRVDRAPPWPAPQRIDAGVIDGDDQDVRVGGAARQRRNAVVEDLIDPAQSVERTQHGRQHRQHYLLGKYDGLARAAGDPQPVAGHQLVGALERGHRILPAQAQVIDGAHRHVVRAGPGGRKADVVGRERDRRYRQRAVCVARYAHQITLGTCHGFESAGPAPTA
ncbi:hypothetical protein G6F22_014321 [Rhizopus arrhizus]|nr:hypothetical protein G6F22_014321 [Rhizopus arrhizus]